MGKGTELGYALYVKYCVKNNLNPCKQTYDEYIKIMDIVREQYKKGELK